MNTTLLAVGSGVVAVAVVALIVVNLPDREIEMVQPPTHVSVDIGWNNPRVQRVVEWARALHDENDFALLRSSDVPALQTLLGAAAGTGSIEDLYGDERGEAERVFLTELKSGARTAIFREFAPEEGELDTEAMATADTGTVLLQLPAREGTVWAKLQTESGKRYYKGAEARVRVSFRMVGSELKVTGWEEVYKPAPPPEKKKRGHEQIARPEVVEREFAGETILVKETELVALPHLDDTPTELRTEIDQLIARLMDLDAPGAVANRSIDRLVEIGKPAVPRLLTQMYETPPQNEDERLAIRRVIQALQALTGMRFGFNVADRQDLAIGGTDEERLSALRQWYAWWYDNHDRDFTRNIDKEDDESLFLTDEDKAALESEKKAAEAGASKRER